jgi:hypothetical protein
VVLRVIGDRLGSTQTIAVITVLAGSACLAGSEFAEPRQNFRTASLCRLVHPHLLRTEWNDSSFRSFTVSASVTPTPQVSPRTVAESPHVLRERGLSLVH